MKTNQNVVCCSCDWYFKVKIFFFLFHDNKGLTYHVNCPLKRNVRPYCLSLIMCDRRRSLHDSETNWHKFWGSSVYLDRCLGELPKFSARSIPRMLAKDQESRLDISKRLLSLYGDDSEEFMHRDVTKDETLGQSL